MAFGEDGDAVDEDAMKNFTTGLYINVMKSLVL